MRDQAGLPVRRAIAYNRAMSPAGPRMNATQWLICVIASIGFAFDIYELLMLPLVVGPALQELLGVLPGTPDFQMWTSRLFYWPAICGGVFGLVGGYLTDRLGRRRVLTWSILIYATGAFLAGFSTSVWMLLFFRCLVFIGVCVEFVAAVAWLAELFPDPKQRERVLGYTQAFSSFGGLLIAFANGLCVQHAAQLPSIDLFGWFGDAIKDHHAAWRYTLMTGLIPAFPLLVIRPFLPESPAWQQKRAAGTLKRPSLAELFTPEFRRTTLVTTAMFAMSYGAAFGAIQHIPRIVPGLAEVKTASQAAAAKAMEGKPEDQQKRLGAQASRRVEQAVAAKVTKVQELGGLLGRAVMAALAVSMLLGGGLHFRTLAGWSVAVAWLLMEALADFGGSAGDHALRLGIAVAAGAVAAGMFHVLATGLQKLVKPTAGNLLRIFQLPGLVAIGATFAYAAVTGLTPLKVGIFLAGFFTVAQFSFWGNYLPRVYPLHLRGTGESFAANIGGRLIGTSFAWLTASLATTTNPAEAPAKLAYTAAAVGVAVYLVGLGLSFFLPEPPAGNLED
jgi:MFS family permease